MPLKLILFGTPESDQMVCVIALKTFFPVIWPHLIEQKTFSGARETLDISGLIGVIQYAEKHEDDMCAWIWFVNLISKFNLCGV